MFGRKDPPAFNSFDFSDAVRRALAGAREEAVRLQHDHVGTEHILLGLIGDPTTQAVLRRLDVSPGDVRSAMERRVRRGISGAPIGNLPYTSRAKKTLEFALAEARENPDRIVTSEDLLAGLLREEKGLGADVLISCGVTLERVRAIMPELRRERAGAFEFRIDDASDRSIYEQIVAQVTEGVATGALRPGERLPTVRNLADLLDVAPGTVARAYGELERRSVVTTEGARGTRVAQAAASPAPALDRPGTLTGLLRPVAVAAFHLGASAPELRASLEEAMRGIFDRPGEAA